MNYREPMEEPLGKPGLITPKPSDSIEVPKVRRGLGRTLVLLLWGFILVPIVLVLTIVVLRWRQSNIEAVHEKLTAVALLKEAEIESWVETLQKDMEVVAADPSRMVRMRLLTTVAPYSGLTQFREDLQEFVEAGGRFEELFLVDGYGRVVASTNVEQEGNILVFQPFFARGMSDRDVQVYGPFYSPIEDANTIIVTYPIIDLRGENVGILAGRANLDRLNELMVVSLEESVQHPERGTLDAYVVGINSFLLTDTRFGTKEEISKINTLASREVRNGNRGYTWGYPDYRGEEVVGVYRSITLGDLKLGLIVENDIDDVSASLNNTIAITIFMAVLIVGLAMVIARDFTRRTIIPLEYLTEVAVAVAGGDLDWQANIERDDEIGVMAAAFDVMTSRLRELIANLESRVAERTSALQDANYQLQRRAIQMEAAAEVGQAITSILDLDELLMRIVEYIRDKFGFYHAGIFLVDPTGGWAVLEEATGEVGVKMKEMGHRLEVGGHSIVGWVTGRREPRIALDVGDDAVHFANPLLPHTRSEMALPLVVGNRLLGALDVQSTEEAAFEEDDITILSLMANQVAVAIDNARKFSEESAILEATSPLFRATRRIALATKMEDVLGALVDNVISPAVDRCGISLFSPPGDPSGRPRMDIVALWDRAVDAPYPAGTSVPVRENTVYRAFYDGDVEPIIINNVSAADIDSRVDSYTLGILRDRIGVQASVMIPLVSGGRSIGILSLDSREPHAWSEAETRSYTAIGDQTANAVENARLFAQVRQQAERVQRVNEISARVRSSFDFGTILEITVQELGKALNADEGFIRLGTGEQLSRGGNGDSSDLD